MRNRPIESKRRIAFAALDAHAESTSWSGYGGITYGGDLRPICEGYGISRKLVNAYARQFRAEWEAQR